MRFKGSDIKEPVCIYKKFTNETVSEVTSSIEDETERNDEHIRNIVSEAVESDEDILKKIAQMETELMDHLNPIEKHESVIITQS